MGKKVNRAPTSANRHQGVKIDDALCVALPYELRRRPIRGKSLRYHEKLSPQIEPGEVFRRDDCYYDIALPLAKQVVGGDCYSNAREAVGARNDECEYMKKTGGLASGQLLVDARQLDQLIAWCTDEEMLRALKLLRQRRATAINAGG